MKLATMVHWVAVVVAAVSIRALYLDGHLWLAIGLAPSLLFAFYAMVAERTAMRARMSTDDRRAVEAVLGGH